MTVKIKILCLLCALLNVSLSSGQSDESLFDINLPKITHFSRNDFQSDAQFWDMTVDDKGIYYFGNNDGVVIYDGEHWSSLNLPNSSSVRSLCTSAEGKVYAGGYNELGVIEQLPTGKYSYQSLTKTLNLENENLENLWQAHRLKSTVVFRTFGKLLVIKGTTATHINSKSRFVHSDVVHENLLVQEMNTGVFQFDPKANTLKLIFDSAQYNNEGLVAFLPQQQGGVILVSKSGNLYSGDLNTKQLVLWKSVFEANNEDQVISAAKRDGQIFLGTLSSKIISIDDNGIINRNAPELTNLYDSTVLNLYEHNNNLWALLNNGLDFIAYDAPVSKLFDEASIYDISLTGDTLYLATNKGVFYAAAFLKEQASPRFQRIPGLEGQAWSVQQVDNDIIISHDRGLFLLREGKPFQIGTQNGFWKLTPIPDRKASYLASNYNGIYLLQKTGKEWEISPKIEGFNESTRDISKAREKNSYWVCHGYKGVYKIGFDDTYSRVYAIDHFTDTNGFLSPFNINVTRYKDTTLFTSNTGIYTYNYERKTFEPFEPLNRVLDSTLNTRTILAKGGRTWIVQDDEVAYFDQNQPKILHKNLFLNLKGNLNKGMERFLPLDKEHVLIGAKTGLFLYSTKDARKTGSIPTHITGASYFQGEQQTALPLIADHELRLPNETDILQFRFAAPQMPAAAEVEYSYMLDGIDTRWSQWNSRPSKEYTHLGPGSYTFKVKSRNLLGKTGTTTQMAFTVPALWYQTNVAFAGYLVLFIAGIVLTHFLVQKRIKTERRKAKIENYKTKKLLELEIEQLKLKQEKDRINKDKQLLQEDNIEKSKELANYTMLLVKKKDIFTDTYANLKEFKKTLNTQTAKKRLNEVLQKLNQHRIGEEYMNIFDVNFEKVHHNFFKELRTIDPNLSQRELRLCAFVKMNLSNKEIAPLLNISVRGVETARYRIRKKLDVQDPNFNEFLQNLSVPTVR